MVGAFSAAGFVISPGMRRWEAGGLVALNFVPDVLVPLYGRHNPVGAMTFVRLRLG